jgi:hypothetical protein
MHTVFHGLNGYKLQHLLNKTSICQIIWMNSRKSFHLVFWVSNPVHGDVYSIQHYMIKFVSDFRQIGGFLRELRPVLHSQNNNSITILLFMGVSCSLSKATQNIIININKTVDMVFSSTFSYIMAVKQDEIIQMSLQSLCIFVAHVKWKNQRI